MLARKDSRDVRFEGFNMTITVRFPVMLGPEPGLPTYGTSCIPARSLPAAVKVIADSVIINTASMAIACFIFIKY
ncbi:hypothetical protein GCM10007108_04910 [Thermogymnomonas acidicola]|uniref:Uncharacterized protein n=1 Tax=Thermogymnomonas acidicola TaxID=399579 RepID=A0AA37F8Z3_9ARCH|nr:hypothetical protein GCM10007108_04910 [Thermogymnomonas acidicola]